MLFVSHDLDEVREVTDRVTVLRDGHLQGTVVTADTTEAQLVEMIIGRRLESLALPAHELSDHEVEISVKGLSGGVLRDVGFEIRRGEIVGITGLAGSGFEDVPYYLFGAKPAASGTLRARGATFDLPQMSPDRAVGNGFALLPGDRQRDGSVPSLTGARQRDAAGAARFQRSHWASAASDGPPRPRAAGGVRRAPARSKHGL